MIWIPASAHLNDRWNRAIDQSAALGVFSLSEVAAAWGEYGPDQVLLMLLMLRMLTAVSGERAA